MSFPSLCPSCSVRSHVAHLRYFAGLTKDLIGGTYCPCTGECQDTPPFNLREWLDQERKTMPLPYAEIVQVSKYRYNFKIIDGITGYGPTTGGCIIGWSRFGKKRIEKKARKEVAKYNAKLELEKHYEEWRVS